MHKREIRGLFCSMLIGDGCLSPVNRKTVSSTSKFSFRHSLNQKDFAVWKMELINSIFRIKNLSRRCIVYQGKNFDNRTNKIYYFINVTLNWARYFRHLRKRTHKYINEAEIKDVEYLLSQMYSPLHLAIWLGDYATEYRPRKKQDKTKFNNPHITLCTDSFTEGQNNIIKQWFNFKYKINPVVYSRDNGLFRLHFSVKDSEILFNLIKDYLKDIPSMRQKFWLSYNNYF